jgi:hypothetical protein
MLASIHSRKGPCRMTPSSTYQSYLLRLWRDTPRAPWRALLQSTADGEKYHFVEIDALFAFLTECLASDAILASAEQPEQDLSINSFAKSSCD